MRRRGATRRRRTRRAWLRWPRVVALVLGVPLALPPALILMCRFLPPPATPYMVARAFGGAGWAYEWVSLRAIAPALQRAVIAAEDARFLQHHGFDWVELESAWRAAERGRRLRGASTISMQSARTLLLWPGRSLVRKALEAYGTVWLELLWPKRRILEVYLNLVEWGDGVYGCEAAAQRAFGTSCAQLGAEQAARLAAVLPNPYRWSAARPGPYVRRRVATILVRMPQVAIPAAR